MKHILGRLAVPLTLLLAITATSSKANVNECDVVWQMAERGRVNATTPIEIIEKEAVEAIAGASACVENFNQAAQRITMVFGGVDLTPAKEYLRQTVCSVAGKVVKQAQNEISKTTGVDTRRFITAPPSASGQPPDQIRPSEPEIKSVWERVSCALGNC